MIELRKDRYSTKASLINTDRGKRPSNLPGFLHYMEKLQHKEQEDVSPSCPFCVGNEEQFTPVEISRRYDTAGKWVARMVPNKYPGIPHIDVEYVYNHLKPRGYHDLLIESNRHDHTLGRLDESDIEGNFKLLIDRMRFFESDPRIKNITLFKNFGDKAGASQYHSHWQLLASDMEVRSSHELSLCPQCAFNAEKSHDVGYEIYSDEYIIVYAPFVSEYAYEVNIAPIQHINRLTLMDEITVKKLSSMVKYIVQALESIEAPYNIYISYNIKDDKHLVTSVVPRIHTLGGFELATGININPVDPLDTVKFYKEFVYR